VSGTAIPSPTLFISTPLTVTHGQSATFSITVFNPTSTALTANVSIQIAGLNNYVSFDVVHVKVNANSQSTGYYDWTVPAQTGSYTIMLSFLPPESGGVDVETVQVT
jgi:hypothetical protein